MVMQTVLYQQFQLALNSYSQVEGMDIVRLLVALVIILVLLALRKLLGNVVPSGERPKDSQNDQNASTPSPSDVVKDSRASKRQIGKYKLQTRSFCLYKNGGSPSECEDKSAISSPELSSFRVAIADGTTEGIFSDIWAELLVNNYIDQGVGLFDDSNLQAIHQEFIRQSYQQIAQMPEIRHWAMYEKLERGTHATLAAIEFSTDNTVRLSAVGDSCIFWLDEDNVDVEMLPELATEDFGFSPDTICHIPKTWRNLQQKVITRKIKLNRSCLFVLCTDAIAFWLAKETREKNNLSAWEEIIQLSDTAAFNQLIEKLRESKEIRNDDATLVIINATTLNV
jgi:serine/threonine protein phosphatase PrpC